MSASKKKPTPPASKTSGASKAAQPASSPAVTFFSAAPAAPPPLAPPAVMSAPFSYAGVAVQPPAYDKAAATSALTALAPHLFAIPSDELAVLRLDVSAAALAALRVYAFVTQVEATRARFQRLHDAGEIDVANVERLRLAALAVIHAHGEAKTAGAFASDVKVPASLVHEGMEVEARMQALCEYKFANDPAMAPLLAALRPGKGYRDLAGDLDGYAGIYEKRAAQVATDDTNYRATDLADARRIAGEILAHLSASMSPRAREAYVQLQRAWMVLLEVYDEVRAAGLWLFRKDPRRDELFPSLYAAARVGRPRKKKSEGGKGAGGEGEGEGEEDAAPVG